MGVCQKLHRGAGLTLDQQQIRLAGGRNGVHRADFGIPAYGLADTSCRGCLSAHGPRLCVRHMTEPTNGGCLGELGEPGWRRPMMQ